MKINPKDFLSKIKIVKINPTVGGIWAWEIALALFLLLVLLALDFLIYVNFALAPPQLVSGNEDIVIFKKAGVDRTVKKIQNYVEFLDRPFFPFAKSPF